MLVSVEAASARLGVSISTTRRLIRTGALPLTRISRRNVRVPAAAVEQYIAARTGR
jgi:excisionase family DNA binding protein